MADRYLYDFLGAFDAGINSDLPPLSLDKNMAAWSQNATIRNSFINPRPPLFKRALDFGGNSTLQAAVEKGFYQGGGYYRPDFGSAQLVAQISGRQYTFTEQGNGTWMVVDITVPGDPNSATTGQVWMAQAEKWLIITDGTAKLPLFWDGAILRRSYGPSVILGSVTAVDLPGPNPINTVIKATIAPAYTGAFNIPVLFNGEFYQTLTSPNPIPTYPAILKNLYATHGSTIAALQDVVVSPKRVGVVLASTGSAGPAVGNLYVNNIPISTSAVLPVQTYVGMVVFSPNTLLTFSNITWNDYTFGTPYNHVAGNFALKANDPVTGIISVQQTFPSQGNTTVFSGALITLTTSTAPDVIIGKTNSSFVVPAIGANVTVDLSAPYTGVDGQVVWIGNQQFAISNPAPAAPSTTLYLVNLTDVAAIGALPMNLLSVPELPAGRMGAYVLGHYAECLTNGISFIYGDTVGGPSGSAANNYRDAVLKTTENTFLLGGGTFRIPNSGEIITSMTTLAVLDAAYGMGPLEIGTSTTIFTCAVPTDRSTWIALTNPILTETLIGKGPLAQNSTILANSDTLFRTNDGLGSMIFGRREFTTWGNVPISAEMNRTIDKDDRSLLSYGSAVVFDNRFLCTAAPQVSAQGVYHIGTMALNFDPVSSLKGKASSVWESLWTGTNVLQYLMGMFNSVERCFQFTFNAIDNKIELWEQLRWSSPEYFDNGNTRIKWTMESPVIFKPQERDNSLPIVRLTNGKMHLAEVVGTVHIKVEYKPDFWPCWVPWHEFDICAKVDPTNEDSHPGYRTPVGLGEPSSASCEEANNRPFRSARFFQIKTTITGHCVLMGMEFAAVPEPTINFPPPICDEICVKPIEVPGEHVPPVAASCAGTDTQIYGLAKYTDGDILNSIGIPALGGEHVWPGTFPWVDENNPCCWMMSHDGDDSAWKMNGRNLCGVTICYSSGLWTMTFYAGGQILWQGTKSTGISPAGVFIRTAGYDTVPYSLTVVGMGGTTISKASLIPFCLL